jgi:hypothetical protein
MLMGRDIFWPFSKVLKPDDAILCAENCAAAARRRGAEGGKARHQLQGKHIQKMQLFNVLWLKT